MREFFKDLGAGLGAGFVAAAMVLCEVAVVVVMVLSFAAFAAMCSGCGSERGPCDTAAPSQIPSDYFHVGATSTTLEGVRVDVSGHDDLMPELGEQIDLTIRDVYQCLEDGGLLDGPVPVEDLQGAWCYDESFEFRQRTSCVDCLAVKVPKKWETSCIDAGIQLLPIDAPDWYCLQKGLTPTNECPCRWRAGIQDGNVLITTPDLGMFRHELMRYITGCQLPSASPVLSRCL